MIKIALLDSWPNLEESAELEFIKRFIIASENIGDIEARRVVTSDDIYNFSPDAVLASHEFSRKLTEFPTIGLLWSPLSFFSDDEYRKISIQSYDGYVVGNEFLRQYVSDINFSRPIRKPVGKGTFLPTTYTTNINALEEVEDPTLCYLGVHWDGSRHGRVFEALTKRNLITVYGPSSSWKDYPNNYGGMVPFDGRSVQKTIAKHGIALCFHKKEHRQQNTPSMRIFEALSVGAIPICDNIEFARTELSDVALFVDTTKSPKLIAEQIDNHIQWIRNNKADAIERVRKGKKWFEDNWSLEQKIRNVIIPTIESIQDAGLFSTINKFNNIDIENIDKLIPECEIVIRAGGRDLSYLRRAINSVVAANCKEFPLGIIVVDYKSRSDIRSFVSNDISKKIPVTYITSEDNGYRSTALWNGLRAAKAPFVAHLDDDDSVHPNHYRQLRQMLQHYSNSPLAYSGVIKKEDSEGCYFDAINFRGGKNSVIEENRQLFFMSDYDLTRLAQFDNYIQSNTWMARREVLSSIIEDDPQLEVIEDVYLYLLLAQRGPFAFTGSATAVWHWRSAQADNSMTSVSLSKWMRDGERVARRLENLRFNYVPDLGSLKLLKPKRMSTIEVGTQFDGVSELEPIDYETIIDGGTALSERVAFKGFHPAEVSGVWSREEDAQMVMKLDGEVQAAGGEVTIEFISSDTGEKGRYVEFRIGEENFIRVEATGWGVKKTILGIPSGSSDTCTIHVKIDSLFSPGSDMTDTRKLGVHIKSLHVSPVRTDIGLSSNDISNELDATNIASSVETYVDISSETSEAPQSADLEKKSALKAIGTPTLSIYRKNNYAHVVVGDFNDEHKTALCKLLNNSGKHSIQFDLLNMSLGDEIDNKFIEIDNGPVFRIYLNNNKADIRRRLAAIPERLRNVVHDIVLLEEGEVVISASREAVEDIMTILKAIQFDLRRMAGDVLGIS